MITKGIDTEVKLEEIVKCCVVIIVSREVSPRPRRQDSNLNIFRISRCFNLTSSLSTLQVLSGTIPVLFRHSLYRNCRQSLQISFASLGDNLACNE